MTRKSKKNSNKLAYCIPKFAHDALYARGGGKHKYIFNDAKQAGKHADMMNDYIRQQWEDKNERM